MGRTIARPRGAPARLRRVRQGWPAASAVVIALLLAGCADDEAPRVDGERATASPTTPAIDAQARPAVEAYEAFVEAANNAERRPVALGQPHPPGADFTKHSFDPLRAEYASYIADLNRQGVEFRGTAPTPDVEVADIDMLAKPYPTVMLTDCPQESADWQSYQKANSKVVPTVPQTPPPPYEITSKVIYYDGRWGVQSATPDTSRTCG